MADKEELVSRAKLAEQAERWVQLCYLQFRGPFRGSVDEWLGHSLADLGVDGSSLLTALQRCDGLNSP